MICVLGLLALCAAQEQYGYLWRDSFQNLDNWVVSVETGAQTGNNEWEYYTNSADNVFIAPDPLTGQNSLVLQALDQSYNGYSYTSGKVVSSQMFGPYGFFNVRATVPKGNGLWPAIWLLPVDSTPYGTWAACGEIDFMETICTDPTAYSTLHFGGPWPNDVSAPSSNAFPMNVDWSQPHNFGVEWQPSFIRFWLDSEVSNGSIQGTVFNTVPSSDWYSTNAQGVRFADNAPFNTPFNIVLNLAIGGNWPCSVSGCCENVAVPARMVVDFVEVWELVSQEQ
jgi:beta-glucanase (GH16 family)